MAAMDYELWERRGRPAARAEIQGPQVRTREQRRRAELPRRKLGAAIDRVA